MSLRIKDYFQTPGYIIAGVLLFHSTQALGASYRGQARVGAVNSQVKFTEPLQGEESNDAALISTRLFLEANRIRSRKDQFVLDLRDRYDFFGKSNSQILSLESVNELQIRQAAYKKPWEINRSYYTIFTIPPDAFVHEVIIPCGGVYKSNDCQKEEKEYAAAAVPTMAHLGKHDGQHQYGWYSKNVVKFQVGHMRFLLRSFSKT